MYSLVATVDKHLGMSQTCVALGTIVYQKGFIHPLFQKSEITTTFCQ